MGLFNFFAESRTLYYPGEVLFEKYKEHFELYQEIFMKLGMKFNILNNYLSCGLEVLEAGYEGEARKLARRNFEIFKNAEVKEIITTSPECYKMFVQDYPEILFDWDIKVLNVWDMIIGGLEKKPRLIKNKAFEIVTFHDNCYLGRGCWTFNAPRRILELIGYEVKEMEDFRENSLCCGSCGGLSRVNSELASKMARERLLQAKRIGVKKMVVLGFDNYNFLKKNIEDTGIEVLELSEVLGHALGIKEVQEEADEIIAGEDKIIEEVKANTRLREEINEEEPEFIEEDDKW